ncbi:MAG: nuclease-related domain-containing protein, partial [Candidatus Helarchaeota archaeon]
MTVKAYYSGFLDFEENEKKQITKILKNIYHEFQNSKQTIHIILDYIIGKHQYDLIILKDTAIISVEVKNYEGKVIGSENSEWYVITDQNKKLPINGGKNIFRQVRSQRYELMTYINEILKSISNRFIQQPVRHISSIVCFKGDSSYDINQIERDKHLWFNVLNEINLTQFLSNASSNEFVFKQSELSLIIEKFGVVEYSIDELFEIDNVKDDNKFILQNIINEIDLIDPSPYELEKLILRLFNNKLELELNEILILIGEENGLRLLETLKELKLVNTAKYGKISLQENWKELLKKQEEINTTKSHEQYLYRSEFWLAPLVSKENGTYQSIYRGTKYHFNSDGRFWWSLSGTDTKLEIEFSDNRVKNKLLNCRPLGGSFRITESGEIITKKEINGEYRQIFVTMLTGDIIFKGKKISWKPLKLKKGDLWPSIYDGTTFGINANRQLFIKVSGRKFYAVEGHEKIVETVLQFKPQGGRIKINENGAILTLMYSA